MVVQISSAGDRVFIEKITVEGVPKRLKLNLGFAAGDSISKDTLVESAAILAARLAEWGSLRAQVTLDTIQGAKGMNLHYKILAGEPVRIAHWRVTGDQEISGRYLTSFLPKPGTVFTRRNLEHAVRRILSVYELAGYPLAEVVPGSVEDSAGMLIPELGVSGGPRVFVSFLEFQGANKLAPDLLLRLARFRSGKQYSPVLVRYWATNLDRSEVVRVNGKALVVRDTDTAVGAESAFVLHRAGDGRLDDGLRRKSFGVRYQLQPLQTSRILAAIGYTTVDQKLTGSLGIGMNNILNTGRRLQVEWKSFARRTGWQLYYVEPTVFVPWLGLEGTVRHDVFDTTASRSFLAATGTIMMETGVAVTLVSGLEQIASTDVAEGSRITWLGTGIRAEMITNSAIAQEPGVTLEVRTMAGRKSTGMSISGLVGRFEIDGKSVGPRFTKVTLASSVHYRQIYSDVGLSRFEWYHLGGTKSLRGYREEEFSSPQLGWGNCEFRWTAGQDVVVYPFGDVGWYKKVTGWGVKFGYGLGMRVATRLGLWEIDYGIPWGNSLLLGKVHLAVGIGL